MNLSLDRVMFNKTALTAANQSMVLKEYIFFLGMVSKKALLIDIRQSDILDLTEVFWLLDEVPRTNWSDVEPILPKSLLPFSRECQMRQGDFAEWVKVINE